MATKKDKSQDPIQEIRDYREKIAKKFNYDVRAIAEDLQERGKKSERKFSKLKPQSLKKSA